MNWKKDVVIYCRCYIDTVLKVLWKTKITQNLDLLPSRDSHTRISLRIYQRYWQCLTLFNVKDSCFSIGCIVFLRHTYCLVKSPTFSRHCRILKRKIHADLRLNVLIKFKRIFVTVAYNKLSIQKNCYLLCVLHLHLLHISFLNHTFRFPEICF